MELPAEVMVHNESIGMKGTRGDLLAISEIGYYELNCGFGDKIHRVMLPVASTVLIATEAENRIESLEVER